MKLTPEEYLLILHRRNELDLTLDEKEFIENKRLQEHTEWSTYLHYLKKITFKKNDVTSGSPIAEKVLSAGKMLKMKKIDIDQFERLVKGYDTKQYPEIGYIIKQIISTYKYPVIEQPVADIPPL